MNIYTNSVNYEPLFGAFADASNYSSFNNFSSFFDFSNSNMFFPQLSINSIWTNNNVGSFLSQYNFANLNNIVPKYSFNLGFNGFNSNFGGNFNTSWHNSFVSNNFPAFGSFGTLTLNSMSQPRLSTNFNPDNSKVKNLSWWKSLGYNEEKGKRLSKECKKWSKYAESHKIKGECVGYVRRGINDAFYGGKQHYKRFGKAWACGDQYLSGDSNFKKINITGLHFNPEDVPAGVFVLYKNYSSNPCGHGEVSDGNGHGDSDYTSNRLFQCNGKRKEPYQIWIPV